MSDPPVDEEAKLEKGFAGFALFELETGWLNGFGLTAADVAVANGLFDFGAELPEPPENALANAELLAPPPKGFCMVCKPSAKVHFSNAL